MASKRANYRLTEFDVTERYLVPPALKNYIRRGKMTANPLEDEHYSRIKRTMESIAGRVRKEASLLNRSEIDAFVHEILQNHKDRDHIFLLGEGRSGLVARAFAMRLMHLGFDVYVFGEVVTPAVRRNDFVIAVSGTGETAPVNETAKIAKQHGARIAVVTSNTDSSLGRLADDVVTIRGRTEADETSFLERQVTGVSIALTPLGTLFEINAMVFLDSVIAGLIAALEKKEEELAERHSDLRSQAETSKINPIGARRASWSDYGTSYEVKARLSGAGHFFLCTNRPWTVEAGIQNDNNWNGGDHGVDSTILYILIGATAGVLSGVLGIGGGIILVPALVLLIGLTQHEAQGTTMILLTAPFGLLAALTYYQSGYVDLKIAAILGVGFFFGAFIGAKIAINVPNVVLEKVFGVVLLLVALKMLLSN
jgi:6-phospho-3-hexuloisomerase